MSSVDTTTGPLFSTPAPLATAGGRRRRDNAPKNTPMSTITQPVFSPSPQTSGTMPPPLSTRTNKTRRNNQPRASLSNPSSRDQSPIGSRNNSDTEISTPPLPINNTPQQTPVVTTLPVHSEQPQVTTPPVSVTVPANPVSQPVVVVQPTPPVRSTPPVQPVQNGITTPAPTPINQPQVAVPVQPVVQAPVPVQPVLQAPVPVAPLVAAPAQATNAGRSVLVDAAIVGGMSGAGFAYAHVTLMDPVSCVAAFAISTICLVILNRIASHIEAQTPIQSRVIKLIGELAIPAAALVALRMLNLMSQQVVALFAMATAVAFMVNLVKLHRLYSASA